MRCSCVKCGTYMVHDNLRARCVCPECANTCDICVGGRNRERIERVDGKLVIPEEIRMRIERGE